MKKNCNVRKMVYKRKNGNKPWFTQECQAKRKKYFVIKNYLRNDNSDADLGNMNTASRAFKKQLCFNGSQLVKMKESISDMSLP